jgi:hypothetical protein
MITDVDARKRTPRAIGYRRVSTAEQAGSGRGLDAQLTSIESAAARLGDDREPDRRQGTDRLPDNPAGESGRTDDARGPNSNNRCRPTDQNTRHGRDT